MPHDNWRGELKKEWNQFTEDDTKNPQGLSFVILEEDEKTIFDWWLEKIEKQKQVSREEVVEKAAKIFGSHESPHTESNCRMCKILSLAKE